MKKFAGFAMAALALLGLAVVIGEMESNATQTPTPAPTPTPSPNVTPSPDSPPPEFRPLPTIPTGDSDFSELSEADTGTLTFSVGMSHEKVPAQPVDELYAMIDVEAGDVVPETRAPLNVALVLDRSGSMRGDPIAKARDAARTFVDALGPQDRVALVSFDGASKVESRSIPVDSEGRAHLHRVIDGIRAGGATNISDGLRDGYLEVQENSNGEMLNRVVMMTDGIPNAGIRSTEGLGAKAGEIRQNGVTVTALGFGTGYDADMMVQMATEGAGNSQHISSAADLERAFADEIADLQNTVAAGLSLELLPTKGVEIEHVYGFSRDEIEGGERLTLGDLQAGAKRSAVVKLRVDEGAVGEMRNLLDIQAQYRDRMIDEQTGQQFAAAVDVVASDEEVVESINSDVMARVEEVRSQDSVREVLDLYAQGQREQAQQRLRRERQRVEQNRREYEIDEDSESAKKMDGFLDRIGSTMRDHAPSAPAARQEVSEASVQGMDISQGR